MTVAASFALTGCIAGIHEERAYGPSHAASAAEPEVHAERREGEGGPECRTVSVTPMVREVDIRRSFVKSSPFDAQATNAGLAGILGAASVLIGYDLSTLACSQNHDTGCSGQTQAGAIHAETLALALAAIPTAFLLINELRVRASWSSEAAPPEVTRTEWGPCDP